MIITCTACQARFVVKPAAIGDGRKVKCTKCANVWFQEPQAETTEEAANANEAVAQEQPGVGEPAPDGAALPRVVDENAAPIWLKAASVVLALAAIIGFSLLKHEPAVADGGMMSGYYAMFGAVDTQGIALEDIKVQIIEKEDANELFVVGKITNKSESDKIVPPVRVAVYDAEGDELKNVVLETGEIPIKAGEAIDFSNTITHISDRADKVILDLGNPVALALR